MTSSDLPLMIAWIRPTTHGLRRQRCSIPSWRRLLPVLFASCACLSPTWAATYKWTDEHGRVHYGDTIPPTEIHRSYEKIDRQGLVDKKIGAVPDSTQRAAEQQRAEQMEAEQEAARRRAIHDQVLLETYQDKSQVRAAYDAKLSSLDSSITLATSVAKKLVARRGALITSAAASERGGGEVTQKLRQEIRDLDQQIEHQRKYIEERHSERKDLEETAAQDIERFAQLQARQLEAGHGNIP